MIKEESRLNVRINAVGLFTHPVKILTTAVLWIRRWYLDSVWAFRIQSSPHGPVIWLLLSEFKAVDLCVCTLAHRPTYPSLRVYWLKSCKEIGTWSLVRTGEAIYPPNIWCISCRSYCTDAIDHCCIVRLCTCEFVCVRIVDDLQSCSVSIQTLPRWLM